MLPHPSLRPTPARLCWAAVVLPCLVYLAHAAYRVRMGALNSDEGFYLMAAWRVMEGALPYRDFAYPQMPLLPYLNGVLLRGVGFGLFEQRSVNSLWGLVTVVVVSRGCLQLGGPGLALLAGLCLAASPGWVAQTALGKTHAATGMFLALAGAAIVSRAPDTLRGVGFAVATAAALACRLTIAPVLLVLWLAWIAERRGRRARLLGLLLTGGVLALLVLPFVLSSPGEFFFWNWHYHLASTLDRRTPALLVGTFLISPPVWLLLIGAVFVCLKRRAGMLTPSMGVMAASIVGLVAMLSVRSAYAEYTAPLFGLAALGAGGVVGPWLEEGRWRLTSLALPLLALWGRQPPVSASLATELSHAAAALQTLTRPGDRILAPVPLLPLEAGRDVLPGLEAGPFALSTELTEAQARAHHLVTPGSLRAALERGEAAAVVLMPGHPLFNFGWSVPSIRPTTEAQLHPLRSYVTSSAFRVAFRNPLFIILVPTRRE